MRLFRRHGLLVSESSDHYDRVGGLVVRGDKEGCQQREELSARWQSYTHPDERKMHLRYNLNLLWPLLHRQVRLECAYYM